MKLLQNMDLKLISLAIAAILWVMVTGKEYRYGDFNIPIEVTGLPERMIIAGRGPDADEVKNSTVRIRATETVIKNLDERMMFLEADLSGIDVGHQTISLTSDMVRGKPPGAEITDISPSVLEVDIELKILRTNVPVIPSLLGKPKEGYDIYDSYCIPPTVSIQGPESVVEKIEKVATAPVRIEGLTSSLVQPDLAIVSPGRRVSMSHQTVELRVEIGEKIISKDFSNIPVVTKGTRYEAKINPKTLRVRVKGPVSQINKLTRNNIKVVLVLNGDEPLQKNLRVDNPQLECVPRDSFPDVEPERFSQGFVDLWLTNNLISP